MVQRKQRLVWALVMGLVSVQLRAETMAQPEQEELRMVPPEAEYLPRRPRCPAEQLRLGARVQSVFPSSPVPFRSTLKDWAMATQLAKDS